MALPTLWNLFEQHEGKGVDKWASYFQAYEENLRPFRSKPVSLLEIGVQNGGSLELWSKFFPAARAIIGCDIDPKCEILSFEDPRISVVVGDANSPDTLEAVREKSSAFDIIIDDGSHVVGDVLKSFALYFPLLSSGGVYVVEDIHTSYWVQYGGGSDGDLSTMGFFKILSDLTNREFWRTSDRRKNLLQAYARRYGFDLHDLDLEIERVIFGNSICIINKNSELKQNMRYISGNQFDVVDLSAAKHQSGTMQLVDALDVQNQLLRATEAQSQYLAAAPEATKYHRRLNDAQAYYHRRLNDANAQLTSLREELRRAQDISTQRQEHIVALYASTSWKVAAPVRIVGRSGRRVKRIFDFVKYLTDATGGSVKIFGRCTTILRERGLSGLIKSMRNSYFNMRTQQISGAAGSEVALLLDEKSISTSIEFDSESPDFSVIIPVYNTPEQYLRDAVNSVIRQDYQRWELCLVDDKSSDEGTVNVLAELASADSRIRVITRPKNGHISAACNDGIAATTGSYVTILDHDDMLHKSALSKMAEAIIKNPGVDYLYSDEDKLSADGERVHSPFYKPDWSPEYMLSMMYTCHMSVFSRASVKAVGGFRSEFDGAQDYDLVLRVVNNSKNIHHVPHVLYHWRIWENSTAHSTDAKPYALERAEEALRQYLKARNENFEIVESNFAGHTKVRFIPTGEPLISIVIPTANQEMEVDGRRERHINAVVESVLCQSTYKNVEIIVVHNGDLDAEQELYFESVGSVKLVHYQSGKFNLAEKINLGAAAAAGEFILVLNDDIRVISPDWLDKMVAMAQRDGVGVVGAKLLFPDNRIQHAGVTMLGGLPGHAYYEQPAHAHGYGLSIQVDRNYIAVTGACHMTPSAVFRKLGGYNVKYALNYNDVDYCLRAGKIGLRCVYLADVELYHYEGVSKDGGRTVAHNEIQMFLEDWATKFPHDPYYNPNLNQSVPYN